MNPYPHHQSLAASPHHPPGEPHHGYGSSGNGTATTPDPSPHSPPYGPQDSQPYQQQQQQQGMAPSNGHHQAMMQEHHRPYQHPHMHMAGGHYPPVNHNNNCTIKQEGGTGMATSIQQCAGCGNRITDRWVFFALERYWHNSCLKCSQCHTPLAEIGQSCYSKSNMLLCKNDYARLFGGGSCGTCGQSIPPTELVTRAGNAVFHTKCFTCTKCGVQLTQGDRYYLMSGSAVCEQDFNKMLKSSSIAQGAAAAAAAATGNGGLPTRKGKVGRPRRSRE